MPDPLDLLALVTDGGLPGLSDTSFMPGESAGIPSNIPDYGTPQFGRRRPLAQPITPRIPKTATAPKPKAVRGNQGIDLSNLGLGELLFLTLSTKPIDVEGKERWICREPDIICVIEE